MGGEQDVFQELAVLLDELQRDYPHWSQDTIISQLRRTMPEYVHGVWSAAMPFNRGDSELSSSFRSRFEQLRGQAIADEQLDLAHVVTSIDVKQSIDIIRDAYASWAGDLGTHVLSNFSRETPLVVGAPDSLAGLEDLHGDIDGDNIARHMPQEQPLTAVLAYYQGDETVMDGVTIHTRFTTFARDLGLMDESGQVNTNAEQARHIFRERTREFITLNELDLDARHPLKLLKELFDGGERERVNALLNIALDQFLEIIISGIENERRQD